MLSTDFNPLMVLLLLVWIGIGVSNLLKVRKKARLGIVASIIFSLLGPLPPVLAFLFAKQNSAKSTQKPQVTTRPDSWSVVRIIETERGSEPLGTEVREIDNSKSEIQVIRRFTVSREYMNACSIDYENATSVRGDLAVSVPGIANMSANLEKRISEKYSITNSQKRTYTEEITLTIPAKKKVLMNLNWKQVWQHGIILLKNETEIELSIPFKVSLEPTFDQQQIDSEFH